MRTKKSIINIIVAVFMNILTVLIGLVSQKFFLMYLGTEYLGINGLFTNIISMLGIVELGIGAAIIYNLYEPIAKNDKEKIKTLMEYYKISYRKIAIIVFVIGIIVMLFLEKITGTINIIENIYIIYFIYLIDVVFSYCLSYKRSLIYANQENFIINLVHILYLIIMNGLQLWVLIFTKNYYVYLIIKVLMRICENLILTIIANKKYPFLKEKNIKKLDNNTKKDINKKVKALLFHKIGSYVVLGTDNILISNFLGITIVGLYNNYSLIINTITNFVMQFFSGITASIGNMLVDKNEKHSYAVYKKIRFACFWISCFCAIAFYTCMTSFVAVWLGKQYVLDNFILLILSINLYLSLFRYSVMGFKEAAGIFHEDRYMPLIEAFINLIMSLIFVKFFNLAGIFLGTICSNLFLHLYSYYKYIYKNLFKANYKEYYFEFFKYAGIFLILIVISSLIVNFAPISNAFLDLVSKIAISCIIPNFIIYLFFKNSSEFSYFIDLMKKTKKRFTKK